MAEDEDVDMELDSVEFYTIEPPWNTLEPLRDLKPPPHRPGSSAAGAGERSTAADFFFDRQQPRKLVEERDLDYVINVSDSDDEKSGDYASTRGAGDGSSSRPTTATSGQNDETATRLSKRRLFEMEQRLLEQKRQAALDLLTLETQRRQRTLPPPPAPAATAVRHVNGAQDHATGSSKTSEKVVTLSATRNNGGRIVGGPSNAASRTATVTSSKEASKAEKIAELRSLLATTDRRVKESQEQLEALRTQVAESEENLRVQQKLRKDVADRLAALERQPDKESPIQSKEHNNVNVVSVPVAVVVDLPELDSALAETLKDVDKLVVGEKDNGQVDFLASDKLPGLATVHFLPDSTDVALSKELGLEFVISVSATQDETTKLADQGTAFQRYDPIVAQKLDVSTKWKIDPLRSWCTFEGQGGVCRDPSCSMQHAKDIVAGDDKALAFLLRSLRKATPNDVFLLVHREILDMRVSGASSLQIAQKLRHSLKSAWTLSRPGSTPGKSSGPAPFLLSSLHDIFSGKRTIRNARYFENQAFVPDEFETQLEKEPSNESLWAEYALGHLRGSGNYAALAKDPQSLLTAPLHVLSRGLQNLPESEVLWSLYLQFYSRIAQADNTRAVFDNALQLLPSSVKLLLLYLCWEPDVRAQLRLLQLLERHIVEATDLDVTVKSHMLVDLAIFEAKSKSAEKNWVAGANTLAKKIREQSGLFSSEKNTALTPATTITESHLAYLLQILMHILWHRGIPADIICDEPNSFIANLQHFLIDFSDSTIRLEPEKDARLQFALDTLDAVFNAWQTTDSHRYPLSSREVVALQYLACNTARFYTHLRRQRPPCISKFVDDINNRTVKGHSLEAEAQPRLLRQPNPYDFFDTSSLLNFVPVSFVSEMPTPVSNLRMEEL